MPFKYLKKVFSKKDDGLFSLSNEPTLDNAFEFSKFNLEVKDKLIELLVNLREKENQFTIEKPLRKKKLYKDVDVDQIINEISKDLEYDYIDAKKQFDGESIGFTYYLGSDLIFSNSIEILRRIYHMNRQDLGNIYFSFVIKYDDGIYYYWN